MNEDIKLNILATHRGIWAVQLKPRRKSLLRMAGRLNNSASKHTLLTVALTAALRSISKAQAAELAKGRPNGKPLLTLCSSDATFLAALQAKIRRQPEPIFRTGRNFLIELARQLVRFEIAFEIDPSPFFALQNWALQTVPDPRSFDTDVFAPSSICEPF